MLDILFLSWNRWEFTELSLRLLFENTNWELTRRLVVYDDGSDSTTVGRLQSLIGEAPCEVVFRQTHERSPVGVMLHYLRNDPAEQFAKIDNDIAVPPGWLESLLCVWSPEIDLLGMEIGHPHGLQTDDMSFIKRMFVPARHIGGVGMMRSSAFGGARRMRANGRFGFTEWQHTNRPRVGWIFPEVNAPCLDRVPVEPWVSLSAFYEQVGWQRPWWKYPMESAHHWDWFPSTIRAEST